MGVYESEGDAGYYQQHTGSGEMKSAHEILQAAQKHMQDRAATYDKPEGERSMSATVEAFGAITGVDMTEEQGWLFMAVLKAVRSQQGDYRADSYEDGAAYFALAGEAAAKIDEPGAWIPNRSKELPVNVNTNVLVEYRDGVISKFPTRAGDLRWGHLGNGADIIAYRIIK